jgi:hypothetical protein
MSIGKVVRHFEGIGKAPIDIGEVIALVRQMCPDEIIKVRGVDVDPHRLKGNCYRYKIPPPVGSVLMPTKVSMIVYSTRMHSYEQRLVCCKEIVHIVNPDPVVTSTAAELVHLAEKVSTQLILRPGQITPNDLQVFLDQLAKWYALAILFPFGLREELLANRAANEIDRVKLAEALELPVEYIGAILSPSWVQMRESILAFN